MHMHMCIYIPMAIANFEWCKKKEGEEGKDENWFKQNEKI